MKKHWLISVAAMCFVATNAFAVDSTVTAPTSPAPAPSPAMAAPATAPQGGHTYTLEEARKRAHERADKLDKMTPEEFAAQQGKRKEWRDKWKSMTPEQKEAMKQKRKADRDARKAQQQSGSAPLASPASGAPTPMAPSGQ